MRRAKSLPYCNPFTVRPINRIQEANTMNHHRIQATELLADFSEEVCVLDVRTDSEVAAAALRGALHIPLVELTPDRLQTVVAKNAISCTSDYMICQGVYGRFQRGGMRDGCAH